MAAKGRDPFSCWLKIPMPTSHAHAFPPPTPPTRHTAATTGAPLTITAHDVLPEDFSGYVPQGTDPTLVPHKPVFSNRV